MKLYFSIFLCILFGVGLISCQSDENEEPITPLPYTSPEGYLLDGGLISDVNLTLTGKYKKTNIVKDYADLWLLVEFDMNAPRYQSDDVNEMTAINNLEKEYHKERSAFIIEAYREYNSVKFQEVGWPTLFTAYTNGEVSITCDKTLYGEEPGTNLSEHLSVISMIECLPVGVVDSKLLYSFGDEIPTKMSKLFVNEAWLRPEYYLEFINQPSEKYDELTFYLTMPVILEHTRAYAVAKYKGKEFDSLYSESVFKAECLIKFDWN